MAPGSTVRRMPHLMWQQSSPATGGPASPSTRQSPPVPRTWEMHGQSPLRSRSRRLLRMLWQSQFCDSPAGARGTINSQGITCDPFGIVRAEEQREVDELLAVKTKLCLKISCAVLLYVLLALKNVPVTPQPSEGRLDLPPRMHSGLASCPTHRYTVLAPKRNTSLSSVITPSTRSAVSSHAHCASASWGAMMYGMPKSCARVRRDVVVMSACDQLQGCAAPCCLPAGAPGTLRTSHQSASRPGHAESAVLCARLALLPPRLPSPC